MTAPRALAAFLLVPLIGCATHKATTSAAVKAPLKLQIAVASPLVTIGENVESQMVLSNESTRPVEGCVGRERGRMLLAKGVETFVSAREGKPPIVQKVMPGATCECERMFRLEPGARLSWSEPTPIDDVGAGAALLWTEVQIIYPRRCHGSCNDPGACPAVSVPPRDVPIRDHSVDLVLRRGAE